MSAHKRKVSLLCLLSATKLFAVCVDFVTLPEEDKDAQYYTICLNASCA